MLKQFGEEQMILREGEKDTALYKIVSGKVIIYVDYGTEVETVIGILRDGAYFGEIGAFTGNSSIYSVVAYEDCLIMEIKKEEMDEYAKLNYRDLLAIMTNMSNSMVNLRKNIKLLKDDIFALLSDRENLKNRQEIRERIKKSDISRQLVQYQIQMGLKL